MGKCIASTLKYDTESMVLCLLKIENSDACEGGKEIVGVAQSVFFFFFCQAAGGIKMAITGSQAG